MTTFSSADMTTNQVDDYLCQTNQLPRETARRGNQRRLRVPDKHRAHARDSLLVFDNARSQQRHVPVRTATRFSPCGAGKHRKGPDVGSIFILKIKTKTKSSVRMKIQAELKITM